jgi:hypothetical protein
MEHNERYHPNNPPPTLTTIPTNPLPTYTDIIFTRPGSNYLHNKWNNGTAYIMDNYNNNPPHFQSTLGGLANLFPPFFVLVGYFSFLDSLTDSCVAKNWTEEQQIASDFLIPCKLPPPPSHECKIAFSFQRCCLINSSFFRETS